MHVSKFPYFLIIIFHARRFDISLSLFKSKPTDSIQINRNRNFFRNSLHSAARRKTHLCNFLGQKNIRNAFIRSHVNNSRADVSLARRWHF